MMQSKSMWEKISHHERLKFFFLLVGLSCFLSGCLPDSKPVHKKDIRLIEGQLGGEGYYIPEKYFRRGFADFNGGTISLEMHLPEFVPLSKTPTQMWADGEQLKYIRILANELRSKREFSDNINDRIEFFHAFELVGEEYGLIHLKQPQGYVQDDWDVWLEKEGDKNISYITCSEKIIAADVPQCTHHLRAEGIYIQIDYDKRNLPQWKAIQTGVVDTIRSFKSPDTARNVLFQKLTHAQSQTRGDKE